MNDVHFACYVTLISVVAGIVGSVLGLGGGIIVTPALTLIFGIDIRLAIGASLISVIATSSGSAIAYLRDRIANVRIGMLLEVGTTTGGICGALLGSILSPRLILISFGAFLMYSGVMMARKIKQELPKPHPAHPLATKLKLNGSYFDKQAKKTIDYNVDKPQGAFAVMLGAGVLSGLLGIGSGAFKVMAMDIFMKLPIKVSSATSNFMMGATAAASASIYMMHGKIDPRIAGPVAIGVLAGSTIGARIMPRLKNATIRKIFVPVIVYVSISMIVKGFSQ